jgi:hypothetical protein
MSEIDTVGDLCQSINGRTESEQIFEKQGVMMSLDYVPDCIQLTFLWKTWP